MRRPLLLLACCLPLTALAQTPAGADKSTAGAVISAPVQPIPVTRLAAQASALDAGAASDSLSDRQILNRLSRLYRYQAELLMAAGAGEDVETEALIERSMKELAELMALPGMMERPRFRELYRSVVTEYEAYYGVPDTLDIERGDIFAYRDQLFIALADPHTPLLEEIELPTLSLAETQVPLTVNRLVEQSMSYLLRSPEKHLYNWLSRAETYFPMIEQIFEEEGVPDELKYLAMIESGLVPTARSWAAANGMWQFISATGRAYGLDVNTYVDERRDPEQATRAAARHLKDLYELFDGDWQLALAGYNCSPSRIKRAMRRAEARTGRTATFWDIYNDIPRETRGYVPMFIATALIASNPDAFDLSPVEPGPQYAYDLVPVHGLMSLDDVADMAGTDVGTLRALNPALRRGTTPPTREPYYLRIPLGTSERFLTAYEQLPEEERGSGAVEYTVRRGDALGRIAGRYGVSVRQLMETNGLRSTTIHPGQTLVVAVPGSGSMGKVDLAEAQPQRVRYGNRRIQPLAAAGDLPAAKPAPRSTPTIVKASDSGPARSEPAKEASASESKRVVHTVRRGDTLTEIASRYGVRVSQLRQWNGLRSSTIRVGQRLSIHGDGAAAAANTRIVYQVRRGDNLTEIGKRYGVSVSDLREWNNLRGSKITVGQRLYIYGGSQPATLHTVRRGESLGKIASRYGLSVTQLKRLNGLRSNTIHPGQKLKVSG